MQMWLPLRGTASRTLLSPASVPPGYHHQGAGAEPAAQLVPPHCRGAGSASAAAAWISGGLCCRRENPTHYSILRYCCEQPVVKQSEDGPYFSF